MKAMADKDKIKLSSRYESTNAGWGRLFENYKPKYTIPIMVFLAILNSFAMPVVASLIIRL